MIPVHDMVQYFSGSWALSRRILDRRGRQLGRFKGQAIFAAERDRLAYAESGDMTFGSHRGPAMQAYGWDIVDHGRAVIRFTDGRLFHALDLTRGVAVVEHPCSPDQYRGRFRAIHSDCWRSVWYVQGPRKDLIIASQFRRVDCERRATLSAPPA